LHAVVAEERRLLKFVVHEAPCEVAELDAPFLRRRDRMSRMKPPCIWFSKHLSNTWELIALLEEARQAGEFRVVCTHPRASYEQRLSCDRFECEPIGLSDDDYVRYCLDFARRQEVDVFFPGRKVQPIMRAIEQFRKSGVRLIAAADADTLARLNSKARVYADVAGHGIHVPDYAIINDIAGFDEAWMELRARHSLLCYKPDVSVFGLGFHIVTEDDARRNAGWTLHLDEARRRVANDERRRDLMLMQYLPGPERSVDCLARNGELIRCVVRRKTDGGQWIEQHRHIESAVRWLTSHFKLNNLFNVQFRDADGKSYLLEINARMSGGLPFACQSGLALPLWAIRLALGIATEADIPQPRFGVWVPQPELARSV